jgi:hypothetical protein
VITLHCMLGCSPIIDVPPAFSTLVWSKEVRTGQEESVTVPGSDGVHSRGRPSTPLCSREMQPEFFAMMNFPRYGLYWRTRGRLVYRKDTPSPLIDFPRARYVCITRGRYRLRRSQSTLACNSHDPIILLSAGVTSQAVILVPTLNMYMRGSVARQMD